MLYTGNTKSAHMDMKSEWSSNAVCTVLGNGDYIGDAKGLVSGVVSCVENIKYISYDLSSGQSELR